MEWLIMPSNNLRMTASKMGYVKDDVYVIGDECEASLEELLHNLQQEDKVSRSVRREIANSNLVEGDLFPILKAAVNDVTISQLVIKVLSNLTLPMAVIMPIKHQMTPTDWEKRRGVQHMECAIKSLFAEPQVTNILVAHMKNNLEDAGEYTMEKEYIAMMLEMIILIRNVLHIDDLRPGSSNSDVIVSNLLDTGFDDIIIDMVSRDEGAMWVPSLTQLLGLMFRSQKSEQLLQILTDTPASNKEDKPTTPSQSMCESDKKEQQSAGQEESNKSMPKLPGVNGYEDNNITEICANENRDRGGHDGPTNSKFQDGSDIEPENQKSDGKSEDESVSSENSLLSSLCGAMQDSVQVGSGDSSRSTTPTNDINDDSSTSCGSMSSGSSTSTLDGESATKELRTKLSNFAVKFAKKGLDRCILLCQVDLLKGLEDLCFLWVQNFFLPFASHPSVTYADIRHTVSSAVISNLTYLACQTWQDFKSSTSGQEMKKGQSNSIFKKLYLVMAVLKQILIQLRRYSEETLSEEEQKWFLATSETLCCTSNLRHLYPMLLRLFQPKNETVQYLRELVHGNGELLRLFSNTCDKHVANGEDVMLQHFKEYRHSDIVSAYNHLLTAFSQNTLAENEAIFTFMYHIVIDLNAVELFFRLPVLTNFANIWEAQNPQIAQESFELMDYIIFKYTEYAAENPDDCLEIIQETQGPKKKMSKGTKRKHDDTGASTSKKASNQELIDKMLVENEDIKGLFCFGSCTESSDEESVVKVTKESDLTINRTVHDCVEDLISKGYGAQVKGLQTLLLEVCYVKLNCPKNYPAEPIVWQYCADQKSVPIFAFTRKAVAVQSLKLFKDLLQKMGLHQAQDSRHLFPSVPAFWTPEMTFAMAKMLGPVDKGMLKFDVSEDLELLPEHLGATGIPQHTGLDDEEFLSEGDGLEVGQLLRPTHGLKAPGGMWMGLIKKANTDITKILPQ